MDENNKKQKEKPSVIRIIIIFIALGVFGYAAYNLYLIMNDYRKTNEEYDQIRENYTRPGAEQVPVDDVPDVLPKYENASAPLEPDWEALKATNKDVVGWIYVDATPSISYPIVWRKGDDEYYLHRSFEGNYLYAGTIFLEGLNNPDFSDPLSLVYGHNMKNGSMFAMLKNLLDQETYDKNPYFWILTPNGNYRYHIFSVLQTQENSDVYALFSESGGNFLEYEKSMKNSSAVKNDVPLFDDDKCVLLSTCMSDHVHRTVVLGRCVSEPQPIKTTDDPAVRTTEDKVIITPTPVEEAPRDDLLTEFTTGINDMFGVEGN